jgi:hypothetical protein
MPVELTRRTLFNILPAATAGCAVCAGAFECAAQTAQPSMPAWSQNSDMTYEQVFRFAYQKDLIPILKSLAAQMGREKFTQMLQDTVCNIASKGMTNKKLPSRDFAAFMSNLRNIPPLYRAAFDFEIIEETPSSLEYRVKQCLWAKTFRESEASDLGYAMVCSPDIAIAAGFNPKLKLTRTKTLMQGHDTCHFLYKMEA